MTKKELSTKMSATQFALWELHLYLDTHPTDLQAVSKHNKLLEKYLALKEEYEEHCQKLSPLTAQGVEWIKDPWPWEKGGCDC